MRVSVYHNVARDAEGRMINFLGYVPGHSLVHVFDADIELGDDVSTMTLAEGVWTACNLEPDRLTGRLVTLARAYRARCLRSLSVGDVVVIGDDADRTALRADGVGFSVVRTEQLNVVTTSEHGTQPWPTGARPLQV